MPTLRDDVIAAPAWIRFGAGAVVVNWDTTPPRFTLALAEALSPGVSQVAVTFSKTMDPLGLDDPENYQLTPTGSGVAISVSSVSILDNTHVVLTTTPLTNQQTYRLSGSNLLDESGNLLVGTLDLEGVGWRPRVLSMTRVGDRSLQVLLDSEFNIKDEELLNPANYEITHPHPGGDVTPDDVEAPGASSVVIQYSPKATPQETYTLWISATKIRDIYLNLVDPAHNSASFIEEGPTALARGYYFSPGAFVGIERSLATLRISDDNLVFGTPDDLPEDPTDLTTTNADGQEGVLPDGWPPAEQQYT